MYQAYAYVVGVVHADRTGTIAETDNEHTKEISDNVHLHGRTNGMDVRRPKAHQSWWWGYEEVWAESPVKAWEMLRVLDQVFPVVLSEKLDLNCVVLKLDGDESMSCLGILKN